MGCMFGPVGCSFPCRCDDPWEVCDPATGACPVSGCRQGWGGPGCRVGNVALGKSAFHAGDDDEFERASRAVDGNVEPDNRLHSCVFIKVKNMRAWWTVDLGSLHVIYNVTIFADLQNYRLLHDYQILTGLQQDIDTHTATCGSVQHAKMTAGSNLTLTCGQNHVARYVSVHLEYAPTEQNQNFSAFSLCEVQVTGYRHVACTACPSGARCDALHGCDRCPLGKQKPDCVRDCAPYTYGSACESQCHCSLGPCSPRTGKCPAQRCQLWWVGAACSNYVALPDLSGTTPFLVDKSSTSATVQWDLLQGITAATTTYYRYVVEIRSKYTELNYIELQNASPPHGTGTKRWERLTLSSVLHPDTSYGVRVVPYRDVGTDTFGNRAAERGIPSQEIQFTTEKESQHEGNSLSNGAIIGISVAISLVLLLGIMAVCYVTRCSKKRCQRTNREEEADNNQSKYLQLSRIDGSTWKTTNVRMYQHSVSYDSAMLPNHANNY